MEGGSKNLITYSSQNNFNRSFIKKGTAIKLGDKEVIDKKKPICPIMHTLQIQVEYNPQFKLFLHTKMSNPHYKPELQVRLIFWMDTPIHKALLRPKQH